MDIQIGQYKQTGYIFNNNSRTIHVFGFPWLFDQSVLKLVANQTGFNNNKVGFVIGAPTLWNAAVTGSTPSTPITISGVTTGGAVTIGKHIYATSYIYNTGDETLVSTGSTIATTTGGNQTVRLINIPTGNTQVIARNIYRTPIFTGSTSNNYYLLTTLNDNTTKVYNDIIADATLIAGATAPTTTNVYDIKYFNTLPTSNANDKIFIRVEIPDETVDSGLNSQKIINQTPEWSHYIDQNEPVDYTNQVSGTTRDVLYTAGYTNWFVGLVSSAGVSTSMIISFQVPLKSTCVDTDDVNWKDITYDLTGQSSIVVAAGTSQSFYWIWNSFPTERLMIKTIWSGVASNTLTFSYRMTN
jgi:hypothetical protein